MRDIYSAGDSMTVKDVGFDVVARAMMIWKEENSKQLQKDATIESDSPTDSGLVSSIFRRLAKKYFNPVCGFQVMMDIL